MPSIIRPSVFAFVFAAFTAVGTATAQEVCEDDATWENRGVTCANTATKSPELIANRCSKVRPDGFKFSDVCPALCGLCPDIETVAPSEDESTCDTEYYDFGINAVDRRRSYVAADLCDMIYYITDDDPDYDQESRYDDIFGGPGPANRGTFYNSDIDAVYTAKIQDDYCAVVYRGTVRDSLDDWLTNVASFPQPFKVNPDDPDNGCEVHYGFYNAYLTHQDTVEDFLATCTAECPDCDVIITGQSQGGGIAEIASLFYKRDFVNGATNPVWVPVFGSPQSLGQGCAGYFTKPQRCKHLRYIQSIDYEGFFSTGRGYDSVPLLPYRSLELLDDTLDFIPGIDLDGTNYARNGGILMLGYELFLNREDTSSLSLATFDSNYVVDVINWDVLLGFEAHRSSIYASVLKEQSEATYNVFGDSRTCNLPTDGFPNGQTCNESENDLNCIEGVGRCNTKNFLSFTYTCRSYSGSVSEDEDRFCF